MKIKVIINKVIFVLFTILLAGCSLERMPKAEQTASLKRSPRIRDIQGKSHYSIYTGKWVQNVHGVVTMVLEKGRKRLGFFMQDNHPDDDTATSEGIFVYSSYQRVKTGDKVQVSGVVEERRRKKGELRLTQIKSKYVKVISSGNQLPVPIKIGEGGRTIPRNISDDRGFRIFNPQKRAIDFFESMEGMLVSFKNPVLVGPANARYKQMTVAADLANTCPHRTERGGLFIRKNHYNPCILTLSFEYLKTQMPLLKTGDVLQGEITGVLTYEFGSYRVLVTSRLPEIKKGNLARQTVSLPEGEKTLRVATYNIENCSPNDSERILRLGQDIVHNLASPDIIALQEVQDNNGVEGGAEDAETSASKTYEALIKAIIKAGGPEYGWADIPPATPGSEGGQPGGNIRVGFIWRLDRVVLKRVPGGTPHSAVGLKKVSGEVSLSFSPGRIEPENLAFNRTRKPLIGEFVFQGKKIFVITLHLASRRGDDSLFGTSQPPVFKSEAIRVKQLEVAAEFVKSLLKMDNTARVVVLGDFNEFYFGKPMDALKNIGLTNLMERIPESSRYTYVHAGNSQAIDHIFVSPALMRIFTGVQPVHINAEFPEGNRNSDHDPVISAFNFSRE